MLTEAQETAYIHGLLPRLRDQPPGAIVLTEDLAAAGFPRAATTVVMDRLEADGLAKRGYATTVNLTPLGMQVARDPRGYRAHLRWQRHKAWVKDFREALGAYGSIISAAAGIAGLVIAYCSLRDSRQATSEVDNLRNRVHILETQRLPAAETRLTILEKQCLPVAPPPAASVLPVQREAQHNAHKR